MGRTLSHLQFHTQYLDAIGASCDHPSKRFDAAGGVGWVSGSLESILSLRIVSLVGCCMLFLLPEGLLRGGNDVISVHNASGHWLER